MKMNTGHSNQPPTLARRWIFPLAMALLLCTALAIPAARASDSPPAPPISAVPSLLRHNFALFRSAPEVVPAKIADAISQLNAAPYPGGGHGFSVALAQEVVFPDNPTPVWAIPGRDQVMLTQEYGAGGTAPIAKAVRHGFGFAGGVPGTHGPPLLSVSGVVPDGVTAVRLTKTAVAPVVNHTFTEQVYLRNLEEWTLIRGRRPIAHHS